MLQASQLIENSFCCDGHADTFRNLALAGGDFLLDQGSNHLNLPRLRAAHWDLQIMAAYTSLLEVGPAGTTVAMQTFATAWNAVDRSAGELHIVLQPDDLQKKGTSLLLTLEGADPLQSDLRLLDMFYRLGLRSIGLTHNHNSCAAGGCAPGDAERIGLTPFGRELLPEMARKGILVDVAHLGRLAFDDVLSCHRGPIVNSHACCQRFVKLERNLEDQQLRDLARTGGLAAVTFVPKFLTAEARPVTSLDVFQHLEHMVEVAGIDHVGIGSDFDGVSELPTDLGGPQQMVSLVDRMLAAGWSQVDVAKVLGGNWMRVLQEVLPNERSGAGIGEERALVAGL